MGINISQVASVISNIEAQRSRLEQEALKKEQAELNLKLGSENLKTATMNNEIIRKTLPIQIEQEYLRLRQTEAETYMKEFDASVYKDKVQNDLEIQRMTLNSMEFDFMNAARNAVLDPWAEEFFKNQGYTDKDIDKKIQVQTFSVSKDLSKIINDPQKITEYINTNIEQLEIIENQIKENNKKYYRTKDPKYMEQNDILMEAQADTFAKIKITNQYMEDHREGLLEATKMKQDAERDAQTNVSKEKTSLRELFDKYRTEYHSRVNKLTNINDILSPEDIEREAINYAMGRLTESDIVAANFPNATASLFAEYGVDNVKDMLSMLFTGGKWGTESFSYETFETIKKEFESYGGQVYLTESRSQYTPEFENFLYSQVQDGRLDIKSFNEEVNKKRKIMDGNMSQVYKEQIPSTKKMSQSEKISVGIETHNRFKKMNSKELDRMSIEQLNELYLNTYLEVCEERNLTPDKSLFLDFNINLNDNLTDEIMINDDKPESEENNNE